MAYNPKLLERIQSILSGRKNVVEKKMFGSVAFLVNGHMACGPIDNNLIIRIGDQAAAKAMTKPHVRPMTFTGKPLKSFATIEPPALKTQKQLRRWIEMSVTYAESLPKKTKNPADNNP